MGFLMRRRIARRTGLKQMTPKKGSWPDAGLDRTGPDVELQSTANSAEWPAGAVERVAFTANDFPEVADRYPGQLSYVLYFDADGWPVQCPPEVRPMLDPNMKVEFRRYPWTFRLRFRGPNDWIDFAGSVTAFQRECVQRYWPPSGTPPPIARSR